MDKRSKRILLAFGIAIIALAVIETVKPKPVNWNSSYTSVDKIPLGAYVFYNELENMYTDVPVERITQDPFEFLRKNDYGSNDLYLLFNDDIILDPEQLNLLSEFVASGNTAFISANYFGSVVSDSLGIDTYIDYSLKEPEIQAGFYNPALKQDSLATYQRGLYRASITNVDTLKTTALGFSEFKNSPEDSGVDLEDLIDGLDYNQEYLGKELNFVRIPYGDGYFYFHTLPEAFSNYYLLNGGQQYVEHLLSYFNPDAIYWDEYLKSGRVFVGSPMRFVLMQPGLKWAYYLSLLALILLVLFKGKREQRIIKEIHPLANDSKDFAATIGDLHFQYKDYGNIIAKRITYFLERVRSDYYLNTTQLDEDFTRRLAQKSNQTLENTKELVSHINTLRSKALHTEQDLIKLNKLLDKFTH